MRNVWLRKGSLIWPFVKMRCVCGCITRKDFLAQSFNSAVTFDLFFELVLKEQFTQYFSPIKTLLMCLLKSAACAVLFVLSTSASYKILTAYGYKSGSWVHSISMIFFFYVQFVKILGSVSFFNKKFCLTSEE